MRLKFTKILCAAFIAALAGCSEAPEIHIVPNPESLVKGEGVFNDDGKEVIVHAGDICATGYGQSHGLENKSSEPVEMIALIVME